MSDETSNKVRQEQGKETRKDPTSKQLVEMVRSGCRCSRCRYYRHDFDRLVPLKRK